MKLHVLSPAADGWIDPPTDSLFRQLPNKSELAAADAVLVPISFKHDFKFDERLGDKLNGKKWVLSDWSEFGWQWDQQQGFLWGRDRIEHPAFRDHAEYQKFDQFVRDNPPVLTFQRELLEKDRTDKLLPIEYLSWLPEHGNDTKDDFLKRPLEVSYYWGRSSEWRVQMQGDIFAEAAARGFDVLTQFDHVDKAIQDNANSKKWLAVFTPHYSRIRVEDIQYIVRKSKVTIIMPGAGIKTFRHGEHCGDAIMALRNDRLAWAYPWTAVQNCLNAEFAWTIWSDLQDQDRLYDIYVAAMENARNYRPAEYLRRWVNGNIERVL